MVEGEFHRRPFFPAGEGIATDPYGYAAGGLGVDNQVVEVDVLPMERGAGLFPNVSHGSDVFALAFLYATIVPATAGHGPTLSWPARPGETYQVQFKNTLSDTVWQNVSGTVTLTGNQAQLTDLAPASGQRFYRVVAL